MPAIDSTDLTRLTATERELLALLAAGHTAKSIATLTGRSVDAVNERLRSARRKTGVGSSRELARMLPKDGDEEIGLAAPYAVAAPGDTHAGDGRPRRKGTAMALTLLVAALALATPTPPAAPPVDPLLEAAMGPAGNAPQDHRARFLAEHRDAGWADTTEAWLRARYARVEGVEQGAMLHITCARVTCEVAGRTRPGTSILPLQAKPLMDDAHRVGLTSATQSFGPDPAVANATAFVAYWTRDR